MIFDYSLAALVTAGPARLPRPTPCCAPSGSREADCHDRQRLDSDPALLRDRDRAGEAARLVHDARLHRRAHLPLAGPAAGRGRPLPRRRRRREARAALARPTPSPCCSSTSAASSSSTSLLRLQGWPAVQSAGMAAVPEALSFNTAISFITNTNWQNYGGESTLSYLTQMLGLTPQNFLSAATGIVLAVALIRGFARGSARTVGNFWVDVTRCTLYILIPICVPYALFLVWQGMPQTLGAYVDATTLEGAKQTIARRPGRLADRHQDARHQRRRLLQRQRRASVREPDGAVQPRPDGLDLRASARRSPTSSAAWSATSARAGRSFAAMGVLFIAGVIVCYWAEANGTTAPQRARPHRRQHGGQGGPLRHRRLGAVRRHHDGGLVRRRQRHA